MRATAVWLPIVTVYAAVCLLRRPEPVVVRVRNEIQAVARRPRRVVPDAPAGTGRRLLIITRLDRFGQCRHELPVGKEWRTLRCAPAGRLGTIALLVSGANAPEVERARPQLLLDSVAGRWQAKTFVDERAERPRSTIPDPKVVDRLCDMRKPGIRSNPIRRRKCLPRKFREPRVSRFLKDIFTTDPRVSKRRRRNRSEAAAHVRCSNNATCHAEDCARRGLRSEQQRIDESIAEFLGGRTIAVLRSSPFSFSYSEIAYFWL